jgi:hypothetical protein
MASSGYQTLLLYTKISAGASHTVLYHGQLPPLSFSLSETGAQTFSSLFLLYPFLLCPTQTTASFMGLERVPTASWVTSRVLSSLSRWSWIWASKSTVK